MTPSVCCEALVSVIGWLGRGTARLCSRVMTSESGEVEINTHVLVLVCGHDASARAIRAHGPRWLRRVLAPYGV